VEISVTQFSLRSALTLMLVTSALLYLNVACLSVYVILLDAVYIEVALFLLLKVFARIDTTSPDSTLISSPVVIFVSSLLMLNSIVLFILSLAALAFGVRWLLKV
jgi:hypothetical protein